MSNSIGFLNSFGYSWHSINNMWIILKTNPLILVITLSLGYISKSSNTFSLSSSMMFLMSLYTLSDFGRFFLRHSTFSSNLTNLLLAGSSIFYLKACCVFPSIRFNSAVHSFPINCIQCPFKVSVWIFWFSPHQASMVCLTGMFDFTTITMFLD